MNLATLRALLDAANAEDRCAATCLPDCTPEPWTADGINDPQKWEPACAALLAALLNNADAIIACAEALQARVEWDDAIENDKVFAWHDKWKGTGDPGDQCRRMAREALKGLAEPAGES